MTILKLGSKGENVRVLQSQLVLAGFFVGIDGDFGNETLNAVKAFQKSVNILIDGEAGKATLASNARAKDHAHWFRASSAKSRFICNGNQKSNYSNRR